MRVDVSRVVAGDVLELELLDPSDGDARVVLLPTGKNKDACEPVSLPVSVAGTRARAELGPVGVAAGTWAVRWVGADGAQRPVLTADPCYDAAERRAQAARPAEREFLAVRTATGRLRIRVRSVKPYAQVDRVDTASEQVTLSGRLARTAAPDGAGGAELVARQRDLDGELVVPVTLSDGEFLCTIPLAPLSRAHDHGRHHNEWDLWLRLPGQDRELRLGSHSDDIVGKKGRIGYPGVLVQTPDAPLRFRPYYTDKDNLTVLAVRESDGTTDDGADQADESDFEVA